MFNFKIKVNNEHKLQTKVNNEHSFSIKAFGATIYESISGGIKYTSKTVISKAMILIREKGIIAYRVSQTMMGRVGVRLLIDHLKYKSSTNAKEKFMVKLSPLPLKDIRLSDYKDVLLKNLPKSLLHLSYISDNIYQSFFSSIKEKFIVRFKPKTINFKNNSEIKSEKMIGKMKGSVSYSYLSKNNLKSWIRARSVLKFISNTTLSFKSWLRASSTTLTKYITSIKCILGIKGEASNKIIHSTNIEKEGINARFLGQVTNYASSTKVSAKSWLRAIGVLKFISNTTLSFKSWLRASSTSLTRYTTTIWNTLVAKEKSDNKSIYSTQITKEGIEARVIGNTIKSAYSMVSTKANHIFVKVFAKNNISSKTEADDTKMYQHYAHKLSDFDGKKLNELPQDLLRYCYIVDKNWSFVNKVYKTWSSLKDRVLTWAEIK